MKTMLMVLCAVAAMGCNDGNLTACSNACDQGGGRMKSFGRDTVGAPLCLCEYPERK